MFAAAKKTRFDSIFLRKMWFWTKSKLQLKFIQLYINILLFCFLLLLLHRQIVKQQFTLIPSPSTFFFVFACNKKHFSSPWNAANFKLKQNNICSSDIILTLLRWKSFSLVVALNEKLNFRCFHFKQEGGEVRQTTIHSPSAQSTSKANKNVCEKEHL